MSKPELNVDDNLRKVVEAFNWKKDSRPNGPTYFYTSIRGRKIYLHRFIFGLFSNFSVDHIDQDSQNNCLENLRACSPGQNNMNVKRKSKNSLYRGVYKHQNKWNAAISVNHVIFKKYGFANQEDAARAYDEMAREHHGEFAILNFGGPK